MTLPNVEVGVERYVQQGVSVWVEALIKKDFTRLVLALKDIVQSETYPIQKSDRGARVFYQPSNGRAGLSKSCRADLLSGLLGYVRGSLTESL